MKITVIFTCFNRKEKTVKCMKSLVEENKGYQIEFIVVDDNSSDGTKDAIEELGYHVVCLQGNGSLFWSGGMRKGIEYFFNHSTTSAYVLLVNDDVEFYPGIISQLVDRSRTGDNAVVVGATCDSQGDFSYGAMKLIIPRRTDLYYQVRPTKDLIECDTFNCNCVLIPIGIMSEVGNFDPAYQHSLADLDYGFKIRRYGYRILISEDYIGVCDKNSNKGTWRDCTLSRIERLKRKESIKGAPFKEWFHFMKKNFGFMLAVRYSLTPYLRILIGK